MTPPPFTLLDRPDEVAEGLAGLAAETVVALDLEADGLHSYRAKVCLVQATAGGRTLILDPLAAPGALSGLVPVLEDPGRLKVFHGGDFDVRQLKALLGCRVRGLFDTMIVAQLLGRPRVGLAALLEEEFGVVLDKRFQRADWSRRPLPPPMLAYAALDTAHLPALRDRLGARLAELGRLAWAEEEFGLLEEVEPAAPRAPRSVDLKGAGRLAPRQLAVLQELLEERERIAEARDRPPFKVLPGELLIAWALAPPATRSDVLATPGASPRMPAPVADAVVEAARRGLALPEASWPRPERRRREPLEPRQEQRLRRLREARAAASGRLAIEPGLLASTATLERIARAEPAAAADALRQLLKRWQLEAVGEQLHAALAGAPA